MEVKNSEIKPDPLCLGNISKGFILSNMKKNSIKMNCKHFFSVRYNPINTSGILDILRFLMKEM